jgi:hypothetical protein
LILEIGVFQDSLIKKFTKLLGLKALSELNMLLKLLNKPFLFPTGMKILNSLIRDLLINLLLKASSFCILELSKLLLTINTNNQTTTKANIFLTLNLNY